MARQVYFSPQLHISNVFKLFIFYSHPKLVLIALQATECIDLESQCIVSNVWCILQNNLDIHL